MLGDYAQELRTVLPPGRSAEEELRAFTNQARAAAWVNRLCVTRMGRLGLCEREVEAGGSGVRAVWGACAVCAEAM